MAEKYRVTLTAARVNAGYSIDQVCKIIGKSRQTVINWEKGRTQMTIPEADYLIRLYNVPQDCLILPCESTLSTLDKEKCAL